MLQDGKFCEENYKDFNVHFQFGVTGNFFNILLVYFCDIFFPKSMNVGFHIVLLNSSSNTKVTYVEKNADINNV